MCLIVPVCLFVSFFLAQSCICSHGKTNRLIMFSMKLSNTRSACHPQFLTKEKLHVVAKIWLLHNWCATGSIRIHTFGHLLEGAYFMYKNIRFNSSNITDTKLIIWGNCELSILLYSAKKISSFISWHNQHLKPLQTKNLCLQKSRRYTYI